MAQTLRVPLRALTVDPSPAAPSVLRVPVGQLQAEPEPETEQTPDGHLAGFAKELWAGINPVAMVEGLIKASADPVGTIKGIGAAQGTLGQESADAFKSGDYLTGTRKLVNYLIPILGPGLDRSGDLAAEGKYGAAGGAAAAIGAQVVAPELIRRVPSVTARIAPRNANPAERAAVDFGMREGIPVDAGTATGNPVVRGTLWGSERTLGGSVVGGRARQAQAEGFATVGDRLSARASAAPVTAEQAGQGVRDAVRQRAATFNAEANTAYSRLRALEAQATPQTVNVSQPGRMPGGGTIPVNVPTSMRLAVDIGPTKTAMRPVYDALKRESELVPLMGDKARALTNLDRLMNAPDMAPLSVADGALSEIKALARDGNRIAAQTVTTLDQAVVASAKQGGQPVLDALMQGRAATVNKYKTLATLDKLHATEPVKVFTQLTAGKDSAVSLLRDVQKHAPAELPTLGRAFVEGLLEKATAEGGFGRTAGVMADWERLGPQTKLLLFKNPGFVRDLDSFFLLAKKAAENPNASGTAFQAGITGQAIAIYANPALGLGLQVGGTGLAALLHSPRAVRLIVKGMRIPVGNTAAATAVTAELAKLVRESEGRLVPGVATTSEESQPSRQP